MAQDPRGTHNPSKLTKKRPFTNEHPTKHEFVDSNALGIQPNDKPSPSSKRKRQKAPVTAPTVAAPAAAAAAAATTTTSASNAIHHRNVYINLPHKMPSQRSVPAFLHKLYKYVSYLLDIDLRALGVDGW